MNYVFFGSPEFAAIILKRLIEAGQPPSLIICNPDRPIGRKKIMTAPPTKILAEKHGLATWQPEKLDAADPKLTRQWDFFLVAAYAKIIPADILKIPKLGTLGVHPSLLPKYRGATPIQSVILAGEKNTGTTLFLLDEKMDHGDIIVQQELSLSDRETYATLHAKLADLSADLLVRTLPLWTSGKITPRPQNHTEATFTKKNATEDGLVDLRRDDPIIIDRKVRALNPDPGVYTLVEHDSGPSTSSGQILPKTSKVRIKILETNISNGHLQLSKIQLEGKKPLRVTEGQRSPVSF